MRTIEHKNIPSRGTGFNSVQLINLFIIICDYNEEKKMEYGRTFNAGCPVKTNMEWILTCNWKALIRV